MNDMRENYVKKADFQIVGSLLHFEHFTASYLKELVLITRHHVFY